MRIATTFIAAALVGLAGCADEVTQNEGGNGAGPQTADQNGPFFDNETLDGTIVLTTAGPSIGREGAEEFEVPPGTRELTLDVSWSGSQEIRLRVYNRDNDVCENDPDNCPLHFVTTESGEATLTLAEPEAGTYDISFFAEDGDPGGDSGEYVIEVQREIWSDESSSEDPTVAP